MVGAEIINGVVIGEFTEEGNSSPECKWVVTNRTANWSATEEHLLESKSQQKEKEERGTSGRVWMHKNCWMNKPRGR